MIIDDGVVVTSTGFHLAVGAAGYRAAHTILDGDSLDGGGGAQGDGLLILQTLVGRGRAIYGVDLEPLWQGAAFMQGCRWRPRPR